MFENYNRFIIWVMGSIFFLLIVSFVGAIIATLISNPLADTLWIGTSVFGFYACILQICVELAGRKTG